MIKKNDLLPVKHGIDDLSSYIDESTLSYIQYAIPRNMSIDLISNKEYLLSVYSDVVITWNTNDKDLTKIRCYYKQ